VSLVRTGIAVELPPSEEIKISQSGIFLKVHYELQIRPRSGLSIKHNVIIPNSPGTIDPDYRGEIKVPMRVMSGNWGVCSDDEFALRKPWIFDIQPGDRIAQAVVAMFIRPEIVEANYLSGTARDKGGFGHTGQ
jgi:dUTP pyrophosphatase